MKLNISEVLRTNSFLLSLPLIFITMLMIFFGLKPKGFRIINTAEFSAKDSALLMGRRGILLTQQNSNSSISLYPAFSFEMKLFFPPKLARIKQTIINLRLKGDNAQISLYSWRNYITLERIDYGFFSDQVLELSAEIDTSTQNVQIVISSDKTKGTKIFVNRCLKAFSTNFFPMKRIDTLTQIVLGNSLSGQNPWRGKLYHFNINNYWIDSITTTNHNSTQNPHQIIRDYQNYIGYYDFTRGIENQYKNKGIGLGTIYIPRYFIIAKKQILQPPWKDIRLNISTAVDMIVNYLGFIPFGLFLGLYLFMRGDWFRKYFLQTTMVTSTLLSLFFEIVQVFIPTRCSQLYDVILNTGGAAHGALLVYIVVRIKFIKNYINRIPSLPDDLTKHHN